MHTPSLALLALALAQMSAPAAADVVEITVRTPAGAPVANAVIAVHGPASTPVPAPEGLQIAQQDEQFHPFVLAAPEGATVSFPNLDRTRHHVYSFSPAGPFELRLFGAGETRSVTFEQEGIIAIGCNIHDQMSAFIWVTNAPWTAVTDENGRAVLQDVEAGQRMLEIWHPHREGDRTAPIREMLDVTEGSTVTREVELGLRRPLHHHSPY